MVSSIKEMKPAYLSRDTNEKMGVKNLSGSRKEQQVQRPRGRNKLVMSKAQKEGQHDRKIVSDGSLADEVRERWRGQVIRTL